MYYSFSFHLIYSKYINKYKSNYCFEVRFLFSVVIKSIYKIYIKYIKGFEHKKIRCFKCIPLCLMQRHHPDTSIPEKDL